MESSRGMSIRSSRVRTASALSMAMSVPLPMAMPTSARRSAGASFIPSPAMSTTLPSLFSSSTFSAFISGVTPV